MVGCFDASGHESDQPFLVVAGFVSSAGDWDDFSQKWLDRLAKDGLLYFHASQFAASKGIFDGWGTQEPLRRALAYDLMELIRSHAYRFFIQGVKPADFQKAFTPEERRAFNINAYALCGRSCVADLGRWIRGDALHWRTAPVPDLVFEDGDLSKGKLRDMLLKHNYPEPQFPPGKVPRQTIMGMIDPFVPLQASDWLAYEAFRLLKLGDNNRDKWRWPIRQFFQFMQGVPMFWMPDSLARVKDDLDALNEDNSERVVLAERADLDRFT